MLVLLLCGGFGTLAFAAEAKVYNDALVFFDTHGLSTEGLTRGELKAVYRDITTQAFTYSKTAQVIGTSLSSEKVDGYEIFQAEPTPEDVENLWNRWQTKNLLDHRGIHYVDRADYKMDPLLGFEVLDKSYLEAASDLGANKVESFLHITLPLSLPGVLSGITLVFLPAVSSFFIPKMLGGGQYVLIGNVIESQFLTSGNWNFGSAISLVMTVIVMLSLFLTKKLDRTGQSEGGK